MSQFFGLLVPRRIEQSVFLVRGRPGSGAAKHHYPLGWGRVVEARIPGGRLRAIWHAQ